MLNEQENVANREAQPANEQAPAGGFWRSVIEIFSDPFKVFARIDSGLAWWKPLMLIIPGSVVLVHLMRPFETKMKELVMQGVSGEQLEQVLEKSAKTGYVSYFTAPAMLVLSYLLISLVLKGMMSFLSSCGRYWKTTALVIFCALIPFVETILETAILRAKGVASIESVGDMTINLNLSAIIPTENVALNALFRSLGVFQVWYYVVLILGLAVIFKMSRTRAVIATLPVWFLKYIYFLGQAFAMGLIGRR